MSRPTYKQLQGTLAVGSRVLINGGNTRHYNKRGWVREIGSIWTSVKLDWTEEPVKVCTVDLEVTESDHSRAALAQLQTA